MSIKSITNVQVYSLQQNILREYTGSLRHPCEIGKNTQSCIIIDGTNKRLICSSIEGKLHNNVVWFYIGAENNIDKALDVFTCSQKEKIEVLKDRIEIHKEVLTLLDNYKELSSIAKK